MSTAGFRLRPRSKHAVEQLLTWPVYSRIQTMATVKACSAAVADLANVYSWIQTAATVKVDVASQNGLLACQHIDLHFGAGRPKGGVVQ